MNPEIWRPIFDAIKDPAFLHDTQFRLLLANTAYCREAGVTEVEVLGKPYWEVFPPGTGPLPGCKDAIDRIGSGGSLEEVRVGEKLFLSRSYTARDQQGKSLCALHILSDITERKREEEALRESEERYRFLFENMLEGYAHCKMLFEHDTPLDFVYLNVNHAFQTITGLKDVIGKRITELIPGIRESNPELFEIYGRAALTGQPEKFEIYLAALGVWLSITAYGSSKDCFVAVFDNITERKTSENKLRLSVQLLDSSADSIMAFDLDGNFIYLNEAAWKTRGYTRDELMAMNLHSLDVPAYEKFIEAKIGELMLQGSNIFEAAHRCKDGSIMPIEVTSRIIESDGRKLIISAARDITGRKQAQADLVAQLDELRRWHDATLGREGRVLELKCEVNDLLSQTGKPARYLSAASPNPKEA